MKAILKIKPAVGLKYLGKTYLFNDGEGVFIITGYTREVIFYTWATYPDYHPIEGGMDINKFIKYVERGGFEETE